MGKLNLVKKIIAVIAIVICLLGLFKVIDPEIGVDIVLIMLGVIFGIEAVLDYGKGKKTWVWVDAIAAVVLIVFALVKLFGVKMLVW